MVSECLAPQGGEASFRGLICSSWDKSEWKRRQNGREDTRTDPPRFDPSAGLCFVTLWGLHLQSQFAKVDVGKLLFNPSTKPHKSHRTPCPLHTAVVGLGLSVDPRKNPVVDAQPTLSHRLPNVA